MADVMPGYRRHHDLRNIEHGGDLGAVQRACTAKSDQRKAAGIDALLNGARADRVRHVAVDDGEDAFGGFEQIEAKFGGKRGDDAVRGRSVELHAATKEILGCEAAKHDIGVRHGRLCAAASIRGRSWHCAGAPRPDAKGTAAVDIGNRPAAGADCVHVDHRHKQREAAYRRRARVGLGEATANNETDVGASSAYIEGDQLLALGRVRQPSRRRERQRPGPTTG